MRLLSNILWIIAFLAATFCWMVLFEHGFSVKGFTSGVREEWNGLVSLVTGGGATAVPQAPKPEPKPKDKSKAGQ